MRKDMLFWCLTTIGLCVLAGQLARAFIEAAGECKLLHPAKQDCRQQAGDVWYGHAAIDGHNYITATTFLGGGHCGYAIAHDPECPCHRGQP